MSGSKGNRKARNRPSLFVCFLFHLAKYIIISEHLVPSCHCVLSGVWNGHRKSVWICIITGITTAPPTNYLRQNIVFSYPEMIRVSFSLFLSLSLYFIYLFSWKLLLFFHVPGCSGMFHVPGFIDTPSAYHRYSTLHRSHLSWYNIPTLLFCQMQANSSGAESYQPYPSLERERKFCHCLACLRPPQNVKLGIFTW